MVIERRVQKTYIEQQQPANIVAGVEKEETGNGHIELASPKCVLSRSWHHLKESPIKIVSRGGIVSDLHGDGREGAESDKEGEEDSNSIRHDLQHHSAWVNLTRRKIS